MDLEKLTPAPWEAVGSDVYRDQFDRLGHRDSVAVVNEARSEADAEFIALARNAFDVMMRRGWSVERNDFGATWRLNTNLGLDDHELAVKLWEWSWGQKHKDPFSALVEAEQWYVANVEGK